MRFCRRGRERPLSRRRELNWLREAALARRRDDRDTAQLLDAIVAWCEQRGSTKQIESAIREYETRLFGFDPAALDGYDGRAHEAAQAALRYEEFWSEPRTQACQAIDAAAHLRATAATDLVRAHLPCPTLDQLRAAFARG